MKFIPAVYLTLTLFSTACAHPGGVKRSGPFKGCHNDKKKMEFHCHQGSSYNSKIWRDEKTASAVLLNSSDLKQTTDPKSKVHKYIRKDWGYPSDEDSDCQNTRAEILIARSSKTVSFKGKKRCTVLSGEWEDFYYPEKITEASKIQIDHIVPLKNAFDSGGDSWTNEKKKLFANDYENLVITSSKTNQQKGSLGIEAWLPINKELSCRYLERWIYIKTKYGLNIPERERNAVSANACRKVYSVSPR